MLLYGYPGSFTYGQIQTMTREDRDWFVKRVLKQKDDEAKAIENASK